MRTNRERINGALVVLWALGQVVGALLVAAFVFSMRLLATNRYLELDDLARAGSLRRGRHGDLRLLRHVLGDFLRA